MPPGKQNGQDVSPDVRMATANMKGLSIKDVHMETLKPGTTIKRGGLQLWEREIIESPEVKRKATVAQLCMLLRVPLFSFTLSDHSF